MFQTFSFKDFNFTVESLQEYILFWYLLVWYLLVNEPVRPNGWVLVYELSGSGFEVSCSHFSIKSCCAWS